MTPRDRQMAALITLMLLVVLGVAGYVFFWMPYQEVEDNIARLAKEAQDKQRQLTAVKNDLPKLERSLRAPRLVDPPHPHPTTQTSSYRSEIGIRISARYPQPPRGRSSGHHRK